MKPRVVDEMVYRDTEQLTVEFQRKTFAFGRQYAKWPRPLRLPHCTPQDGFLGKHICIISNDAQPKCYIDIAMILTQIFRCKSVHRACYFCATPECTSLRTSALWWNANHLVTGMNNIYSLRQSNMIRGGPSGKWECLPDPSLKTQALCFGF